jgi:four helix bundle protein
VKAVDSVTANISEGFGRYHFKDAKNFYYYSCGSLYETKTWLIKVHNRKLISDEAFENFTKQINII